MLYATVRFDWKTYVIPAEDALRICEILAKAERYEKRYPKEKGDPVVHVWFDSGDGVSALELMSEQSYLSAKLAGEPTKS